jgi:hypothetical protein
MIMPELSGDASPTTSPSSPYWTPVLLPPQATTTANATRDPNPSEIDLQGGRPQLVRRGGLADGTGPSGQMPLLWVGRDGGRWRRMLD